MTIKRYIYPTLCLLALLIAIGGYFLYESPQPTNMSERNKQELALLDKYAEKRLFYRDSIKHEIDSVMLQLHKHMDYSDSMRYNINKQMLMKTQMFSYEDANQFAKKLQMLSRSLGDDNLIAEAKILSSFYLAQSCLFVEALEQLRAVNPEQESLSREMQSKYYFYAGITYQRMAVYVKDTTYANQYNTLGIDMFEKCIAHTDNKAVTDFVRGRIQERKGDMRGAQTYYQKALENIKAEDGNLLLSLMLSSLAKAYKHQGLSEQATYYYIKAVQLNIREAMNSSIAFVDLADYLFTHYKNTKEARKFLGISIDNGEYYGMRSQITRIDSMFLVLSKMKLRHDLFIGISSALIMACVLIILFTLISQNNKNNRILLKYEERNSNAVKENTLLARKNDTLQKENNMLSNSNKLKNVYIGKLLESNCEMTTTVNDFILKSNLMLKGGKYDQLQKIIKEIENHFSKKEQVERFDEIFLSLFPTFITDFKSLLPKDYKIEIGPKEMLTPSMRIFALIRLGISDNQQIAQVLNYTYNTILNYRLRVRNLALNPETFEEDIMKIGI